MSERARRSACATRRGCAAPAAAASEARILAARPARAAALAPLAAARRAARCCSGIADHSSFLWSLIAEAPERLARLLAAPPEAALADLIEQVAARRDDDEDELKRALRRAKHEAALLIALADLGGVWDVVATTEALTRFADAAVGAGVRFLLRREARAGRLALDADAADIEAGADSSCWRSASTARASSTIQATST